MLIYLLFLFSYLGMTFCAIHVEIDVNRTTNKLHHFWKNTGFSPLDPKSSVYNYLLSNDVRVNLALIGALPNEGISNVRIHWLLNMINETSYGYDYTYLDKLLDWLIMQKLHPTFELMGLPINVSNITDIYEFWFKISRHLGNRYIDRYGLSEVHKWRFETWNEPDLKSYNTQNFNLHDYLIYVSACVDGLQSAFDANKSNTSIGKAERVINRRSKVTVGGPAGLFKQPDKHPLCWGLLEMCNSITDADTQQCPLQYISFHKKGDGSARQVLSKGLEFLQIIHSKYPRIRHIPIANDEADILTNWSKDEEWRGDTRYAAMVVKVIIDHYKEMVIKRNIKLEILSNDNGFLNYNPFFFTQRTLLARFQMNNTTPQHIQFIKKPVYTAMGLLSYLGDRYISEKINSSDPLITILTARSRYDNNKSQIVSALIAYVNDTNNTAGDDRENTKNISIVFDNLQLDDCKYVIYVLDNLKTNPFLLWKTSGSPVFPDKELREQMRIIQEPYRMTGPSSSGTSSSSSSSNSRLRINLELALPSVALVHICSCISPPPGRVTHLQALNVTLNEVLLIWKDNKVNSKCIQTYEVEFQSSACEDGDEAETRPFKRINLNDIIFLSYHHAAAAAKTGLDLQRFGPPANAVTICALGNKFQERGVPLFLRKAITDLIKNLIRLSNDINNNKFY